ncbi:MAG: hypothetical protein FJ147_25665 [Deltaproteobacteria bacterium]|nr:hypothetical protein [Deltaproteobacteria bacterium]
MVTRSLRPRTELMIVKRSPIAGLGGFAACDIKRALALSNTPANASLLTRLKHGGHAAAARWFFCSVSVVERISMQR